jgi:hypothetical protein
MHIMKKTFLIIILSFATQFLNAGNKTQPDTLRVGIFANLFIDSSFAGQTYKFKNQMPRHLLPGLDFTEGALLALDSIAITQPMRVTVFDIRSAGQTIAELRTKGVFASLDLIIGSVSGTDYRQLADAALFFQIPFLSATFPNDGGVVNNPFTIILNPTLPVHCKAIYNHLLTTEPTANMIYLRKSGVQEDRLADYFDKNNANSAGNPLLKWKTIAVKDSVSKTQLLAELDSTKNNVIIVGSLDERFGMKTLSLLSQLKGYPVSIMGMPTWETIRELNQSPYKELTVFYSTAFYNTGTPAFESFTKKFTELTNGRPSDLAFKGYETAYNFVNLLLKYSDQVLNQLNDTTFHLFTSYDLRPVISGATGKPDYIENKRIYIIRKHNGTTLKVSN